MIERAATDELDAVVALIAAEQSRPEHACTYLGTDADGIRAELAALSPDWTSSVRVARDGGAIVGVALGDWDAELGRAWIHGPWVPGEADPWSRWARPLVDAVIDQLPAGIDDLELCGETVNTRLADLATDLGWTPTETNFAYQVTAERAAAWEPGALRGTLRDLHADDVDRIRPLHDSEFPATYLPVERIATESAAGERTAIVATDQTDAVIGYATGTVTPDGDGYIDFVAVQESARGSGAGVALVTELSQRLLRGAANRRVNLTVQEHRAPARALYERLGFEVDAAFRGYRRRRPTA